MATSAGAPTKSEKQNEAKQLVNYSVKAQNYMMKNGFQALTEEQLNTAARTQDDIFHQSMFGATTDVSQEQPDPSRYHSMNKSHGSGEGFMLPSIKAGSKGSPFKGFLDISLVTQKIRKNLHSQDGKNHDLARDALFEFASTRGKSGKVFKSQVGGLEPIKTTDEKVDPKKVQPKNTRFASVDRQVQMSNKVLETWINETLYDAEHLDIPGVILKPEHQNPISRYGIDRLELRKAGIKNELIDRVYRALFVYSVGFYELIKKCLKHTEKKYSMITNIWKVFAILLEYCCRTDYRMLISEISKEHKAELEALDKDYQKKSEEQANNEKVLKENLDTQHKLCEELERERMNERQMRLKLEEDYTQNTKNHEEEVQLRLKFESKLNNMHSAHRDLESKYKRVLSDLTNAQAQIKMLNEKLQGKTDEVTELKTIQAEHETLISRDKEEIDSQKRELNIKSRQLRDSDIRIQGIQDQLDLYRYKVQDCNKENTELKLKNDGLVQERDGLLAEKRHLTLELNETKDLLAIYEAKNKELMEEFNNVKSELQENKREMIGFGEINKEREEKIAQLKRDVNIYKVKADEYEIQLGTLQIKYDKQEELLADKTEELTNVQDNLHKMNKARHDLDNKLAEEVERNKHLLEQVQLRDETLDKRQNEINDLEKQIQELTRQNGDIEIKKQGVERQFEMAKKQLNERIANLNEVITGEKETRDLWIDRYEKEQKAHNNTQTELLNVRSELKDTTLLVKTGEVKLNTANRQIQSLNEQNVKFQHMVNESIAKAENLDRELSTQKEILKQMELTKKEYIEKLKKELDIIEKRYQHLLGENAMIGEDFRSQAAENYIKIKQLEDHIETQNEELRGLKGDLETKEMEIVGYQRQEECYNMNLEEYLSYFDQMREDRDKQVERLTALQQEIAVKDAEAALIKNEIQTLEEAKNTKKKDMGVQCVMEQPLARGATKTGSQRGSGTLSTQRSVVGGQPKRLGGGGMASGRRPPAGPDRKNSNMQQSAGSKADLNIDTTSSYRQSNTGANQSPRVPDSKGTINTNNNNNNQAPARNLATKQSSTNSSPKHSQHFPQDNQSNPTDRRSHNEGPLHAQTLDNRSENPSLKNTQSQQQYKTVANEQLPTESDDNNKKSKGEVQLKKNLTQSHSQEQTLKEPSNTKSNQELLLQDSDSKQQFEEIKHEIQVPGSAEIPETQGMTESVEVIEEQAEEHEEEQKNLEGKKSSGIQTRDGQVNSMGQTVYGGDQQQTGQNFNSQSRIRVTLTQEGQNLPIEDDRDENESPMVHQPRPTLTQGQFNGMQNMGEQRDVNSMNSTQVPAMPDMARMEQQYQENQMQQEQLRNQAILAEQQRQAEMAALKKKESRQPTGQTHIRKLIKSAATRDGY